MKPLHFLLPALVALLLTSCAAENEIDSYFGFGIPTDSVDAYVQRQMQAHNVPGLSYAIVNKGTVVHRNDIAILEGV